MQMGKNMQSVPGQVCALHIPNGRCRHPLPSRSPWHDRSEVLSSCIPGKVWLFSQMDVFGLCSTIISRYFIYLHQGL